MVEDIQKIERLMIGFEVSKQNLEDILQNFINRMSSLENKITRERNIIGNIDQRMLKFTKESEKKYDDGVKNLDQAVKVLEANEEIKKYDSLLELEKENNNLLKEIIAKINLPTIADAGATTKVPVKKNNNPSNTGTAFDKNKERNGKEKPFYEKK